MSRGKSLLLGFLVGGIVSSTVTLLSTPKSGREVRDTARFKGEELLETLISLKSDGNQIKEQIAQTSKEGATLIKDLSAEMKQSVENWKRTIEPHQENIKTYLAQIEESLKELEDKTKK